MSATFYFFRPRTLALQVLVLLLLGVLSAAAQCTEAKDADMAKYMRLTKTQDAQGCSECGALALYFCSAKYCVEPEDKRKVSAMITACKRNIRLMGTPYCCPEFLDKEPAWGSMVGAGSTEAKRPSAPGAANSSAGVSARPPAGGDYKTKEDGLNQLLSNPDFIRDIAALGTEDLTLEKLDTYFAKYVPGYGQFGTGNKIDFTKLYYAQAGSIAPDELANKLGTLLKMPPVQQQALQNIFTGQYTYAPVSNYSSGLAQSLYERGKDVKVDYAVDLSVDFFQQKLGDGGVNSAFIDLGGGLLGDMLLRVTKRLEEKEAAAAIMTEAVADYGVFSSGGNNIPAGRQDLLQHYKANVRVNRPVFNLDFTPDYDAAIPLYTSAIEQYKNNPERAYYLYHALVGRGKCKMQKGAYRAAVIDYYLAQEVLTEVLAGKLPDKSVKAQFPAGYLDIANKSTYLKGKPVFTIGTITARDKAILLLNRAYAKYRLADYSGALSDCNLAQAALPPATGQPNDFADLLLAVQAMAEFGQDQYKKSYATFAQARLDDDLIKDADGDATTNFLDTDSKGVVGVLDEFEGLPSPYLYGLPEFFPFDIAQIRGLAYYKAGKIPEAITIYQNLVQSENSVHKTTRAGNLLFTKIGGDISSVYATMGNFYVAKGDYKGGLALFNQAIEFNPTLPQYYASRAHCKQQLGDVAGASADMARVKNPNGSKDTKKTTSYYTTKSGELQTAKNEASTLELMQEAVRQYPANNAFFYELLKAAQKAGEAEKTLAATKVVATAPARLALVQSVYYEQLGEAAKAEESLFLALAKGYPLYDVVWLSGLNVQQKPSYCKLLVQYATKTNNTFIAPNFQKEKMVHTLDSVYNSIPAYRVATGPLKKALNLGRDKNYAKSLGNVEEYLAILNDQKAITEAVSFEMLDKIECLLILKKQAEAIQFAKKMVAKGGFQVLDVSLNERNIYNNNAILAIKTIAAGPCE